MLKNITLSAEAKLIEEARHKAQAEKKTINELFREWLSQYTRQGATAKEYRQLMKKLRYVKARPPYTRDEMNERG